MAGQAGRPRPQGCTGTGGNAAATLGGEAAVAGQGGEHGGSVLSKAPLRRSWHTQAGLRGGQGRGAWHWDSVQPHRSGLRSLLYHAGADQLPLVAAGAALQGRLPFGGQPGAPRLRAGVCVIRWRRFLRTGLAKGVQGAVSPAAAQRVSLAAARRERAGEQSRPVLARSTACLHWFLCSAIHKLYWR